MRNTNTNSIPAFRLPLLLISLVVILLVSVAGLITFYQVNYAGRVFPGVKMGGLDLSGMRPEQAFGAANAQSMYFRSQALTLKVGESKFVYRPADFGVGLDPALTTKLALSIGHEGDLQARLREQARVWWNGVDVSPVVLLQDGPAKNVLGKLAERTQKAPVNADVEIENNAAREIPSQQGSKIDVNAAFAQIRAAIQGGQNVELNLPLIEIAPDIASAATTAAEASKIVGNDLIIMVPKWDEKGDAVGPVEAFRVRSADLPQFVILEEKDGQKQVRLRREKLRSLVEPLAPAVAQSTQNAKFAMDKGSGILKLVASSKVGRGLDIEKTLDNIEAAARSDNRQAMLAVTTTQPAVSDSATMAELGIKELVVEATTSFKGSSQARIANVKVAAARFNGIIIPPKGTFSFNDIVGNISKEDGFEEGLVIVGNRTIKGVGGGVCQVSTTAYQAALRAGFPVVERYNHGYRVRYYEDKVLGLGPGFDSTVYSPWADLKFVNDSEAHLLIETEYNPAKVTVTFRMYGTKDGREVQFSDMSELDRVLAPPDIYEKDTEGEIAAGQIKQVDYAVDGATMSFVRTVTRNGETLISEKVISKYQPWANRFKFGEGAVLPEGALVVDPAKTP